MSTTALGHFIGIVQHPKDGWLCITFDRRGFWKSYAPCKTKEEAMKERRRIKRFEQEYARKRRKRPAQHAGNPVREALARLVKSYEEQDGEAGGAMFFADDIEQARRAMK